MVSLFLVEDEIVMRDGIKKRIDWEKEGIEFVGEASDGELAYPMILDLKPDILLTDIKMPFMDGLQLSELVKKELPDTRIIILSGYDEFSYAQEAVRLGVTEYLLKPIAPAALLKSIRGVAKKIEEEREKKSSEEKPADEKNERLRLLSALIKDTLSEPEKETGREVNIDVAVMNEASRKTLENFLRTGTENEIGPFMDEVFESIGEQNARSALFLNYMTMDMYFSMVRFLKEIGVDASEFFEGDGDINKVVQRLSSWREARDYLKDRLQIALRLRDNGSARRYGKLLHDAVAYIDEHFADEDISLNTVAAVANISPNHFSSIFSQEMGITFIEYLIGKRMERAKELLMTTDLRSSEIAYRVGYKDPHYFSYTFKKTQGMTTREYRARGKEA